MKQEANIQNRNDTIICKTRCAHIKILKYIAVQNGETQFRMGKIYEGH